MRITFWGVRGSIPTPHPHTLRYGGNTPCVEIRTPAGHTIILDCGTGIAQLGKSLAEKTPAEGWRLMVFLSPAFEASLLLGSIHAASLQDFVLRTHFWPFREAIALASSS